MKDIERYRRELIMLGIEDNEDKIDVEPRPEGRGLRPRVKK